MNGYLADVSGSDDESSQDVRSIVRRAKRSTIEATGNQYKHSSRKYSRKRRAPGLMLVKGTIESPIHPDINYHMTKLVYSRDYPVAGDMTDVDSQSDLKRTKTLSSLMQQLPIPTATADAGPATYLPSQQSPIPSELQQKSTIIPCERMTATVSKRQRRLEEGLALTKTPRVLIEGESPYRVVHANAAFTQTVIGTASSIQRWSARQTSSSIPKTRSLKKALHDIVPNRDVHIVLYPVAGSEKISHYLIETKDKSWNRRRRTKHDEPYRAIG
ncbi:unnamed protein product [Cylindrotheca closterium]|uniref:Uncharacterized protein n=1 Tax=Cylindrotheca closterium TaxID=2856 RepID=A0AAD2FFM9_9STRA|nr:unnamed protein product [Cylindrotheca closterium]